MPRRFLCAALLFCVPVCSAQLLRAEEPAKQQPAEARPTAGQEAFFEQKVRPILVARCLECHGDKKQEGGLRVDSRAAVLKGNDSGPAVVAGKPEESRLIEVIGYQDAIRMPPKEKLPEAEIAILTEWIQAGAHYPDSSAAAGPVLGQRATADGIAQARATHWAFQPIQIAEPPAVRDAVWGSGTIDRFILAKLEEQGLSPAAPADRRTLLRRVTFDLIGLPPTAEEVAAFESDQGEGAFARVVDRLLASPHYGERWGRHWLDVARYADTKGYVFTEERKYPFSYTYRDYVVRALNNDLPFDRFLLEQLAADQLPAAGDKGYLAAMGFLTLGRRFGNNTNDIIDDRIDVVTRGLMGLTVTCARCHDHKYDPIPTDDYYSLYGVFASSVEPSDLPLIGAPEMSEAYRQYEEEVAKRQKTFDDFVAEKLGRLRDELRSRTTDYLVALVRKDGEAVPEDAGLSLGPGEVRREVVERWRKLLADTAAQPNAVFGPWHKLAALPADDFAAQAAKVVAELNDAADAQPRTNRLVKEALAHSPPRSMLDLAACYGRLLVEVHNQWQKLQQEKGTEAPPTALSDLAAEELRQVLYADGSPATVSRDDARRLFDRETKNKFSELRRAVESFKANSPAAPPRAMVMNDAEKPQQPHVLIRGNPGRPGKEVPRRFLQVLSRPESPAFQTGSGRLELAQAIVNPDNPLTARVIVNRVWMHHFGKGLVITPSDFGFRGAFPTHPELLDYLAGAFIREGWSLKALHRKILLSNVYQQASDDRPEAIQVDPENRLLWKMNRHRLEFEPMRDALLAVAGRLDPNVGGRPVDLFARPFTTRRSIYGFIDRQDLPGTLRMFDFASPDVSTPARPQTTVPQQALFGMNSSLVIEQARALAARPEIAAAADAPAKIEAIYRLVYARPPEATELGAARQFLAAPADVEPGTGRGWQYGVGEYDETAQQVQNFRALPYFRDGIWRGGEQIPDPALGYVILTAGGGHPGADLKHVAIRRWKAPRDGVVSIAAVLRHPSQPGDGVRGRIVSSRAGELGNWRAHLAKIETKLDRVEVRSGETLDFVVDCLSNESHDTFEWSPVIVLAGPGGTAGGEQHFSATNDFRGPPPPPKLSPLEQLAQALLLANEFVFVD